MYRFFSDFKVDDSMSTILFFYLNFDSFNFIEYFLKSYIDVCFSAHDSTCSAVIVHIQRSSGGAFSSGKQKMLYPPFLILSKTDLFCVIFPFFRLALLDLKTNCTFRDTSEKLLFLNKKFSRRAIAWNFCRSVYNHLPNVFAKNSRRFKFLRGKYLK